MGELFRGSSFRRVQSSCNVSVFLFFVLFLLLRPLATLLSFCGSSSCDPVLFLLLRPLATLLSFCSFVFLQPCSFSVLLSSCNPTFCSFVLLRPCSLSAISSSCDPVLFLFFRPLVTLYICTEGSARRERQNL
jgi:hypothetical protein